jgi:hypothetical protein
MTDRTLIPAAPLEPGEVVQTPSGRVAIVRSVTVSGETTVEMAPGRELAAFRPRHLRRPYDGPAHLVFIGVDAANDAHDPGPDAA